MKNKILRLLAASAAVILLLASCNKYLDQYPHNGVSSDNLTDEDVAEFLAFYNKVATRD